MRHNALFAQREKAGMMLISLLLLLSVVLLPLSLAPQWLRAIADVNPLAYAVDAARALFNNHLGDASVLRGVLIMAVLAVIAVVIAARSFGRAVA